MTGILQSHWLKLVRGGNFWSNIMCKVTCLGFNYKCQMWSINISTTGHKFIWLNYNCVLTMIDLSPDRTKQYAPNNSIALDVIKQQLQFLLCGEINEVMNINKLFIVCGKLRSLLIFWIPIFELLCADKCWLSLKWEVHLKQIINLMLSIVSSCSFCRKTLHMINIPQ